MLRFLLACLLIILAGCSSPEERFDRDVKQCVTKNNSLQGLEFFDALAQFEKYLIARNALENRSKDAYQSLISNINSSATNLPSFRGYCKSFEKCDRLVYPASAVAYPTCLARDAGIDVEISRQTNRGQLQVAAENAREQADIRSTYLQALHKPMTPEMFKRILYRGALLQPVANHMYHLESTDSTGVQSDA